MHSVLAEMLAIPGEIGSKIAKRDSVSYAWRNRVLILPAGEISYPLNRRKDDTGYP